ILHLHAHHFVDLYRHSALREVIVELANGAGAEPRLFESIWIECGGKGGAALSALPEFEDFRALRLQSLVVGVTIVDYADVDRPEVQLLNQRCEFRIILVNVDVRVNGTNFRKAFQERPLVACLKLKCLSRKLNGRELQASNDHHCHKRRHKNEPEHLHGPPDEPSLYESASNICDTALLRLTSRNPAPPL